MSGCIKWDSDKQLKLSKIDPQDHDGLTEVQAREKFNVLNAELGELQDLMYGARLHSALVVLQAMDTGGKDGTIRNVMGAINPQSCFVSSFKSPSATELGHDFLWRIHTQTPERGCFAIFNRSHYEDVLVVRVHNLVPKPVWKKRYQQIVNFEELLAESNTIVMKFFLYISNDEQEARLRKREADPSKSWKLSPGDWKERELWGDYMEAYEDAISKTSTPTTPWYIAPANHKWYRDLIVMEAIVKTLRPYKKVWQRHLVEVGIKAKAELEAMRDARIAAEAKAASGKKG